MLMGVLYPYFTDSVLMHTDSDVAYMREASAVARSTMEGKPEPQDAERATDTDSSRFLFY